MKKALIMLMGALLIGAYSPAYAEVNSNTIAPFVVNWSSATVSLYVVGGATTSAASYRVYADSIAFVTAGGLFPGTTHFKLTDTDKDTVEEFVNYCNNVSTTLVGAEGGIVASIVNGCYDKNTTSVLTVTGLVSCLGAENAKTLYADSVLGISYTIPSTRLARRQQFHITGISLGATITTGTAYLRIYDGDDYADTEIFKYKIGEVGTTYDEAPLISFPAQGELAGSNESPMRFDIETSAGITDGYLSISGYRK